TGSDRRRDGRHDGCGVDRTGAVEVDSRMTQENSMYERILVPVDGSATSNLGLTEACKLAKLTGARLLLLHAVDLAAVMVAPEAAALSSKLFDSMRDAGEDVLAKAKVTAQRADVAAETVLLDTTSGRVSDLVVEQAKKWRADLIVIG